jgi:hypothetical protein
MEYKTKQEAKSREERLGVQGEQWREEIKQGEQREQKGKR